MSETPERLLTPETSSSNADHEALSDSKKQVTKDSSAKHYSSTSSGTKRKRPSASSAFDLMMGCTSSTPSISHQQLRRTQQTQIHTGGPRRRLSQNRPNRTGAVPGGQRANGGQRRAGRNSQNILQQNQAALQQMLSMQNSGSPAASPSPETQTETMQVQHVKGDIFSCKPGSLLVHACNCKGTWGAGVAAAFKRRYPRHFQTYADFCSQYADDPSELVGKALLIAPQKAGKGRERQDWIGCLFTRASPGTVKGKSKEQDVEEILEATRRSWKSLLRQVRTLETQGIGVEVGGELEVGEIVMPRINGGLFRVPWERTEEVLRGGGGEGLRGVCYVYTPSEK